MRRLIALAVVVSAGCGSPAPPQIQPLSFGRHQHPIATLRRAAGVVYPVRESLGAALLAAGRAAEAERVFRDDLVKHPRNGRSLFGLHAALLKQGKELDAAWVQRELDEAWKNADPKLTLEEY